MGNKKQKTKNVAVGRPADRPAFHIESLSNVTKSMYSTISVVFACWVVVVVVAEYNGAAARCSCDDDEIAMAIISGYKSKREKDGEIRGEKEGKLVLPSIKKKKEKDATTLLCYPLWIGFSIPTLVGSCGVSNLFPQSQKKIFKERKKRKKKQVRLFLLYILKRAVHVFTASTLSGRRDTTAVAATPVLPLFRVGNRSPGKISIGFK